MASFSSDRSIEEYARHIWRIQPHPLDATQEADQITDPAEVLHVEGRSADHGKDGGGQGEEEEEERD